tara:strand:+ start:1778 stop:2128 length:351 start_codon:yes stop_codon:yes gene_type:complete
MTTERKSPPSAEIIEAPPEAFFDTEEETIAQHLGSGKPIEAIFSEEDGLSIIMDDGRVLLDVREIKLVAANHGGNRVAEAVIRQHIQLGEVGRWVDHIVPLKSLYSMFKSRGKVNA